MRLPDMEAVMPEYHSLAWYHAERDTARARGDERQAQLYDAIIEDTSK